MWFYKALLTAVISAISVIVSKKLIHGVRAAVLTWATLVLATPLIFVFALRQGWPQVSGLFWVGVGGSVLFYTAAKVLSFRAIRMADLSAVYPLVSLSPIFTLLVATLPPLSERPSGLAIAGVLITLVGAYLLNAAKAAEGIFKPLLFVFKDKASWLMVVSVLVESVVIVFDKLAINHTFPQSTTFTLLVENVVVIVGLLPFLVWKIPDFTRQIGAQAKLFAGLGVLNAGSTILGFAAVGGGEVGLVAALLRTQILLVLLLSYLFFKDKPKLWSLVGSLVMILGVVLIRLGS